MIRKVVLGVIASALLGMLGGVTVIAMQKEVTVLFNDGTDKLTTIAWQGTLEEVLADAGLNVDRMQEDYEPSIPWDQDITEDVQIDMTRVYEITLIDGGERSDVETEQFSVADFFKEQKLGLNKLDEINVSFTSPIRDDMTIVVDRIEEKVEKKQDSIPFETVTRKDANLEKGKRILSRDGKEGKTVTEITYVYKNDELIDTSKEVIEEKEPVDKIIAIGTKEKPVEQKPKKKKTGVKLASRSSKSTSSSKSKKTSSKSSNAVWDQLAACESGGNWSINTGNGYYGGLQFSAETWKRLGGSGLPHEASREKQIEMGKKLQASSGWSAWPTCSKNLGLR